MEKLLRLKIYVDGGINDTPFPNSDNPIEIGEFRYDAKRMGGAPTITASVNYPSCLDDAWTDNVYAEFNGGKYYLKQTPTSSYNNESTMYKHDLELVSERVILDNVYFFDVVTGNPQGDDKPVSNSTKVVFFGDVDEFVARLNSSLQYSGLDYTVVVDQGVETEEKLMSFEDQFFSNVLQEIYNTYEVPYYFEGKTIHIGWAKEDVTIPTFAYGVDDALISITKNNTNFKIVNRITGSGSSDNIPFYYPNNSPKGDIEAAVTNVSGSSFDVDIVDAEAFVNNVGVDEPLTYQRMDYTVNSLTGKDGEYQSGTFVFAQFENVYKTSYELSFVAGNAGVMNLALGYNIRNVEYPMKPLEHSSGNPEDILCRFTISIHNSLYGTSVVHKNVSAGNFSVRIPNGGLWDIVIEQELKTWGENSNQWTSAEYAMTIVHEGSYAGWFLNGDEVGLKEIGLSPIGTPLIGDTITQRVVKYVKTSQTLMPSIYRNSDGAERFYDAINYPFPTSEWHKQRFGEYPILITNLVHNDAFNQDGEYVRFNNPYVEGRPKEHIITFEDIKPTIKETVVNGLRIDMFSEFAYDLNDNDETYEDEEGNVYFKHPYFYGKLRVMDFNLFDHAIENQPMTISFTSGDCGACNFEIGVTEEYPQKNPVQVDANGNLLRDANGMVLAGVEGTQQDVTTFQDRQQDTSKYEVWIALRKEEETYGILMPQGSHKPKADTLGANNGDTFVILGINLPKSYILNAEKKLEAEIIKYMKQNNDEKFTFSIAFSRIYFEENPDVLAFLNENSKIAIAYNNKTYNLYVSSFSYNMSEGDVLPEIRVELNETLAVSQNALQNAISQVKKELGVALGSIDVVGAASPYFLRKDADDEAQGRINFKKGVKFGEGGKVEILDNNSAKLTIEYLEVTKKASFTSLEIQEKTHVGGQMLITPAAINCGEVEEFDDYYRCYFQTKGEDGDEIFNQFAVNDQAICQTFNAWGSKYYWRLVVGVGEDYIDLSKTDCDEGSDAPSAGDKIIQMGNRVDAARQNAIVIAAYGDGSPYIIQYKGINAYETPESTVVTKLSSTENKFTGIVAMQAGSTGLDELQEFVDLQALAGTANINASNALTQAGNALTSANKAQETADKALGRIETVEGNYDALSGYVDQVKQDLQGQIDGAIDSYFYEYEPTTSNYPASEWDTAEEKESHLNDTFTNLTDGRSWRWSKDSSDNYSWVEITDTATTQALALAGQAQDTADSKRRVFSETPYPPYDAGDLWAGGENEPLRRCVNGRESGSYDASDWALADNAQQYADSIKAELAQSIANTKSSLDKSIADTEKAAKDYTDEAKESLQGSIDALNEAKANLEDVYDKATADSLITAAEEDAIKRAEELATAAQELAETNVKAWADGEIDAAEQAAIDEAEKKVNAAKQELNTSIDTLRTDTETLVANTKSELQSSINNAKEESKDYTDEAKGIIEGQIEAVERAKANLEDVYDKATVDGKLSTTEQDAIDAAKQYADAENALLNTTLTAYADGVADDAEKAAIADAKAKVDAAKAEMEKYTDDAIDNIEVGGQNLLRNSGFTGDYLSEQLADESVLESASELYSSPLDHWTSTNATVQDSVESTSGKEVVLSNGSLTQNLFYAVVAGEEYVLSFKAKGGGSVTISVGGKQYVIECNTIAYKKYILQFVAQSTSTAFSMSASASITLCEPQLEKGNTATAWSNSPLDNSSDRAYYQSLKYLNQAIEEGSTVTQGGLILSSTINLGEWTLNESTGKNELTSVLAGMNGVFAGESPNEVPAFWAGGNTTEAIATINKYLSIPSPTTPSGELPYVVTHSGRIIANDAIIRGTIYADSGVFSGFVKKRPTIINPSNYEQYLTPNGEPWWFDLDLSKAGSFIIFEGVWADNPHFYMPQLGVAASEYDEDSMPTGWKYSTLPSGYSVNDVFALIGQKVIIVNNSSINVEICSDSCFWIAPSSMAVFECEASIVDGSDDWVGDSYWKVNWTRKQFDTPDLTTNHPINK